MADGLEEHVAEYLDRLGDDVAHHGVVGAHGDGNEGVGTEALDLGLLGPHLGEDVGELVVLVQAKDLEVFVEPLPVVAVLVSVLVDRLLEGALNIVSQSHDATTSASTFFLPFLLLPWFPTGTLATP